MTERESHLVKVYGQVWNTKQLQESFEVIQFMAPFVMVKRKSDDKEGSLLFDHHPRLYFNFVESRSTSR